ncbi:MAG TPA: TatD family hydrolase [Beijerinckiaceae bacterium]|jgi:predicted metal-dependent TIM-barrel fold hydrolase
MTSDTGNGDGRGNGRFACATADQQGAEGVACPCCGGTLTAATLETLLAQARAYENGKEGSKPDRTGASLRAGAMIIDPHAHMISRTTDDYEAMARAGVVAVIEPAFWLGQPRTSVETYIDYLSMITGFERFRAGQFGIRHYCTVGLNPKEANNEALAEAVMQVLPRFALKDGVVAVGELGYDEQTPLEDKYLRAQIELAKEFELPIMIHTPHRDKKRGTLRTMDVLAEHGFDPGRCVIDHNNEETVQEVLDRGYWVAFSIYPNTKMGNERMTEIVRRYGPDRLIVDSACDWGVSDPLAVPKTALLMAQRGIDPEAVRKVTYANALAVYGLSGQMPEQDWLDPAPVDQRTIYEGNSILRGGQTPHIGMPRHAGDDLRIS